MIKYTPGIRCFKGKKLNTNENQFSISKNIFFLLNIISKNFEKLKFYPDYNNTQFINVISKNYKINKKKIFISNGSDESLFFLFFLFKNFKLKIPKISYPFYNVYSSFHKIIKKNIKFKNILKLKNIFLAIPNSPTGEYLKKKNIIKKINKKKFFLIDEAYSDYYNFGYKKYINNNNNLIIINTLSKAFSAAGIRIGFIFSNNYIIEKIKLIKQCFNSYNINIISNFIGIETLKDKDFLFFKVQKNNYLKFLFNIFFNKKKKEHGNFVFLNKNIDFFFFFKKKNIYFRFFKKNIRITIPNFKIFKLITVFYNFWS
ncbi:MAG: aminotransferase class I/II-fold pyridoxal phosphate-dependent enzyme [Candidatus Carsonella ruddii]|nr:MAG: aminotransferase class I/II-fold pyridoxal phosphate-dependent enzyme [Candidatus Carsonella ruddii]WMC19528.1 MAG: aminotransferase class I/II-fold pyridoxal phosphate-dependent enzyme [Candidatus Carsonella ruddii]